MLRPLQQLLLHARADDEDVVVEDALGGDVPPALVVTALPLGDDYKLQISANPDTGPASI